MKKVNNKKLDYLKGVKIAHRGLWDKDNPENSIGAFKKCIERNVAIELDIHILKDGTLVVFHDGNTLRMTGKEIVLKDAIYDDIKDLKLKNTEYSIPKLSDVLELVNGQILLDIEIKGSNSNFRVCYELSRLLDQYKGMFVIKSFNPFYLFWFRINRPNYIKGLLVSKLEDKNMNNILKYLLFNMKFNWFVKPDFVVFNYRNLPNKKIDLLRDKGILIWLFTLKEDDINKYNYDGYIYEE